MTYDFNALLRDAEEGCANAQFNLALMYQHGDGVVQNYAEAVRYYTLAANQGDAKAQFNLGVMYTDGKGVIQNYTEGVRYYTLAADQGNADAQNNICKVYDNPEACRQMASNREMASKYCLGCGKKRKLKTCARCKVARFCSTECVQSAWTYHKPNCNMWENECE